MRKRIAVALFMLACLLIGGCGSSYDPNSLANKSQAETDNSVEEDLSNTEDVELEEDYADTEGMNESEEEETDSDTPAEVKGIIAMVSYATMHSNTVQIISIDPDTGSQEIISEFSIKGSNNESYQRADNRIVTRNWFSDDFTKMAVSKRFLDASQEYFNEEHAGWIDTDGNFFDATEASGVRPEESFSNTDALQHRALGFDDNGFMFLEVETERVYRVPLDSMPEADTIELNEDDPYVYLLKRATKMQPTCQIDSHTYIMDFGLYQTSRPSPSSTIYDLDTGREQSYIPESDRCNWSGVTGPDGGTIAFFSSLTDGMGKVELYKVPLSGGEPTKITIGANSDAVVDLTVLPAPSYEHPSSGLDDFLKISDAQYCRLLEWK